jgi:hypothetical protein
MYCDPLHVFEVEEIYLEAAILDIKSKLVVLVALPLNLARYIF